MAMKKKIHQNVWGNWNGYLGTRKVIEFGCGISGESMANEWLESKEEKAMTTQHTPGKWKSNAKHAACDNQAEVVIEQEDGSAPIAKVFQIYGDQMQANARLIAAAPELLAALAKARRALSDQLPGYTMRNDPRLDLIQSIDSVIAKATGGK